MRRHTPPNEAKPKPCPGCDELVLTIDVGLAIVTLEAQGQPLADGWRWNPSIHEWDSISPALAKPMPQPVHTAHECTNTKRAPPDSQHLF